MLKYDSISEIISEATEKSKKISELILSDQAYQMDKSEQELFQTMKKNLVVMKESSEKGLNNTLKSTSGLSGGDAVLMQEYAEKGNSVSSGLVPKIISKALAMGEVNACMGKIVALPTAGSCGVIPSILLSAQEEKGFSDDEVIMSLFTAGAIGMVISEKASLAGAQRGCQAECGSAAAMAAGALVELMGGTPEMVGNASAFTLKALLGLVCDPVAGLVEVPCVKRNVSSAMVALSSAEMALAGIKSFIPVDEAISAMDAVGSAMPPEFRETAEGGLATTETAKKVKF